MVYFIGIFNQLGYLYDGQIYSGVPKVWVQPTVKFVLSKFIIFGQSLEARRHNKGYFSEGLLCLSTSGNYAQVEIRTGNSIHQL